MLHEDMGWLAAQTKTHLPSAVCVPTSACEEPPFPLTVRAGVGNDIVVPLLMEPWLS